MKPSPELEAHLREFYGSLWPMVRDALTSGGADAVQAVHVARLLAEHAGQDISQVFGRGYNAAGVSTSFDLQPVRAMNFLQNYRLKLAQSITDTTNRAVTTALRNGLADGDAIPEIRKRVEEAWPDITADKAETIARTETARAYGEGQIAGWDEIGVKRKEWLLSPNPCDLCVAIWRKGPVALTQPFVSLGETIADQVNDYMDINAPPGHPGCRCAVAAVFEE